MGERFLKRFLKSVHRRSKLASADEEEPKLESGTEMLSRSDCLENVELQRKEKTENIEATDEISKQIHQTGGSDMTSGATRLPDDLQKTK
jgi:hypothetical protein